MPPLLMQVVIIAAGYDTRAYRLAQPGVRFYEIDLPHASEKKQELVREHMPKDKVCGLGQGRACFEHLLSLFVTLAVTAPYSLHPSSESTLTVYTQAMTAPYSLHPNTHVNPQECAACPNLPQLMLTPIKLCPSDLLEL